MTTITIIVDETQSGQLVYSPDLQKILQIEILNPSDLQLQITTAQNQIANAQATIASLTPVVQASQKVT